MPPKPRKIPMRMCVGCREMKPKKELLRVVRSPEGLVSLTPQAKSPAVAHIVVITRNACAGPSGRVSWTASWRSGWEKRSTRS